MDGFAVVALGVVVGFGGRGAVVNVVGAAADAPGATCFLASPAVAGLAGLLDGAVGLRTALPSALTVLSAFGVTTLLAVADIAGLGIVPLDDPVVVGLGTPVPTASITVGLDAGEPDIPGVDTTAGLSGTEGSRCAKISDARVGDVAEADASCDSLFVITSTSSRWLSVAADLTVS